MAEKNRASTVQYGGIYLSYSFEWQLLVNRRKVREIEIVEYTATVLYTREIWLLRNIRYRSSSGQTSKVIS